jgi:hypothetical protein
MNREAEENEARRLFEDSKRVGVFHGKEVFFQV